MTDILQEGNWVAVRRGIRQHCNDGRLTPREFAAYVYIILASHAKWGAWRGSAPALVAQFDGKWDLTGAKEVLQSLDDKGYIRRLNTPGKRGNFWIVVNKYLVTIGPNAGKLVDAAATTDHEHPAFFPDGSEERFE